MDLYFECNNGISGDMSVAALIDLGGDINVLDKALSSIGLNEEFEYKITNVEINSIKAVDFNVIVKNEHHHHHHRNLDDIYQIIDKADMTDDAKKLAKDIFKITAKAESKVHNKDINEIHFHEIGAIDSIADVLGFSALFDNLKPNKVYFSTLTEGQGSIQCAHGVLSVPVPAVCEILTEYKLPVKFSSNEGEMITPTGASIAAALYKDLLPENEFIIEGIGYGAGKRKYKNPTLRVFKIKEKLCI